MAEMMKKMEHHLDGSHAISTALIAATALITRRLQGHRNGSRAGPGDGGDGAAAPDRNALNERDGCRQTPVGRLVGAFPGNDDVVRPSGIRPPRRLPRGSTGSDSPEAFPRRSRRR
jgi:hypothetical protein